MFTAIYTTVFPSIDRFFTWLATMAWMPFETALHFLLGTSVTPTQITVTGFTGTPFTFSSAYFANNLISQIADWLGTGIGAALGISDIPFIFGLLILFVDSFFVLLLGRFLIQIITKLL